MNMLKDILSGIGFFLVTIIWALVVGASAGGTFAMIANAGVGL